MPLLPQMAILSDLIIPLEKWANSLAFPAMLICWQGVRLKRRMGICTFVFVLHSSARHEGRNVEFRRTRAQFCWSFFGLSVVEDM